MTNTYQSGDANQRAEQKIGQRADFYLAKLHTKHTTPDEVLDEILREMSHGNVISKRRIIGGEVNSKLSQTNLRRIVAQAGDFLSRVHDVPIKGFGYINGNGEGEFSTPESEIDGFQTMTSEFLNLAERVDVSVRDMSRALHLIVKDGRHALNSGPCLIHNDFCAKHILVSNSAISGIIDFGEVAGSEPILDFVRWDYFDADRFPLDWLQEGYTNQALFDDNFNRRLHLKRIAFSLWVMRWYDMQGYAEGVADARAKLLVDLRKLD